MKRGDFVWIERNGTRLKAMVTVASSDGRSFVLMFSGRFCEYYGWLPLFRADDGQYRDISERVVKVTHALPS